MTVHLFGATSSPSVVGFCMRKTADDNESSFSETAIDTLRRSFYVDDMLRSVPTVEAAKKLIPEMKSLLDKGGFKLTKFISSHRDVIDTIPEDDRAQSLQALNIEENVLPQESALGLKWNVEDDFFTYTVSLQDKPATRRGLLATTASLYDPLGLVAPVVLVPKLIQQELCRQQLDWDDEIPPATFPKSANGKRQQTNCLLSRFQDRFKRGPASKKIANCMSFLTHQSSRMELQPISRSHPKMVLQSH